MELIKKRIRTNRLGKTVTSQFMVDDDFNVPDTKSDVGRIISDQGSVRIEEVKRVENYLRITGKLYFKILYVTDGEAILASMDGKLPFEEMVYLEEEETGEPVASVTRVELASSLIHSRKLGIRAMIELSVHTELRADEEVTVDIEDAENLYKKKLPIELLQLHTSKRDVYRIKEEVTIPGTKENIGTILWTEVSMSRLDTKLVQDAMLLTGELQVFCFYASQDEKTDWVWQSVPFEGRIECMGADETLYHHVYDNLVDAIVEPRMDGDGEMRTLGIEASLEMRILIYEEEKTELLEDAYSLREECLPEKKDAQYEELIMQNHSKYKLNEKLSLPELKEEILQICHSGGSIQVEHMEVVPEGIQIEGVLHIHFLYVKANDSVPFDMWQGLVPFSYLLECQGACPQMCYDITYSLEQLAIDLTGNDEVEMKAHLAFRSFLRCPVKTNVITDLKFRPFDSQEMGKRPGIIGYVVKDGDDLWSLAKRYYTTKEGIMEINEMSSEELKMGDKLLILKENMSIL
ncbi:SPOCS domain-containing protein [Roseburia hominis]